MVRTGFSDSRGAWKIMAMPRPRTRCIAGSGSARRSWPWKRTVPPVMRPGWRRRRRIARAVTLLPHPDSPTSPTTSPGPTSRSTPTRTGAVPRGVWNSTVRPRTDRRGSVTRSPTTSGPPSHPPSPPPPPTGGRGESEGPTPWLAFSPALRVEPVLQPVAEQVEADDGRHDGEAGEEGHPPLAGGDLLHAHPDHDAPLRRGHPHAEPDERQAGRLQDRPPRLQRGLHQDRRPGVGEEVDEQHPPHRVAHPHRRQRV